MRGHAKNKVLSAALRKNEWWDASRLSLQIHVLITPQQDQKSGPTQQAEATIAIRPPRLLVLTASC